MNELDPDLQFIFEKLTKKINFLDKNLKMINNKLHFDVYHKPTNSFVYLHYKSCHPPHMKNNIALLLARDALCELLLITKIIDFKKLKVPF